MSAKVHLRVGQLAEYACGVGKRWRSQDVSSTTSPASVTCRSCLSAIAVVSPLTDTPEEQ